MPPEQKWARRKLNITSCVEVYRGNNDKGEFVIYELAATNEQGALVNQKLSSFGQLPLGWGDYEIAPYYKDGQLKNYTVRKPGGSGGGSKAQVEAVTSRVQALEEKVSKLEDQVKGLVALTRQLSSDTNSHPPQRVPAGAPPDDDPDDIPF